MRVKKEYKDILEGKALCCFNKMIPKKPILGRIWPTRHVAFPSKLSSSNYLWPRVTYIVTVVYMSKITFSQVPFPLLCRRCGTWTTTRWPSTRRSSCYSTKTRTGSSPFPSSALSWSLSDNDRQVRPRVLRYIYRVLRPTVRIIYEKSVYGSEDQECHICLGSLFDMTI